MVYQFDIVPQFEVGTLSSKGLRFAIELCITEETQIVFDVVGALFNIETQRLFLPGILSTVEKVNQKISLGTSVDITDQELLEMSREVARIFMKRIEEKLKVGGLSLRDTFQDVIVQTMKLDKRAAELILRDTDLFRCLRYTSQAREWYVNEIATRLLRQLRTHIKTP